MDGSLLQEGMMGVGTFEAKDRLGALLDEVEKDGDVIITRLSKPIARLVPAQFGPDGGKAQRAAATILARSKGVESGGIGLTDLVGDGRR